MEEAIQKTKDNGQKTIVTPATTGIIGIIFVAKIQLVGEMMLVSSRFYLLNMQLSFWWLQYIMNEVFVSLSENSVPLNPMVNDHYPYEKWLFHWEYTLFSDTPLWV